MSSALFSAAVVVALSLSAGAFGQTVAAAGGAGNRFSLPNNVEIEFVTANIVHVTTARQRAYPSFAVLPVNRPAPLVTVSSNGPGNSATYATTRVVVTTDANGALQFADTRGNVLLKEAGRTLPAEGKRSVRQQWLPDADESLYGLGQHQYGLVNIKRYDFDLWQHNTEIAVPMLVSSKGYGIFWDNPSYTRFGDPRDYEAIPADHLIDATGKAGGLTATTFADTAFSRAMGTRVDAAINVAPGVRQAQATPADAVSPISATGPASATASAPAASAPRQGGRGNRNQEQAVRWEGQLRADAAGTYQFALYANGGYKLWIDEVLLADHWRQNWLPWRDLAKVHFDAGTTHKIKVEWSKDQGTHCQLMWKTPSPNENTSLWSQVGDGVDYYYIGGAGAEGQGAIAEVIRGYRTLTGEAPMMPVWAFGLWQSRQRYETQEASLEVVKGFRSRGIPFDNIVQDWFYWRENAWGSHEFDPARFPDPDKWIRQIHDEHARLMISVWGKFYPGTENFAAMHDAGFLYQPNLDEHLRDWVGRGYEYTFYDAFNPNARELFWRQVNEKLFSKRVDAWWMDATEPDLTPSPPTLEHQLSHMPTTAAGPGEAVLNAYPLLNSQAVYEGQRKAAPDQRVFILTRSGYAGQQRYAAASWSGDISSSWTSMKKQIAAGLGYSISGLPYWTMDSGGFSVPGKWSTRNPTPENLNEWRELNARWFEFAAFVPLLRVHGEAPFREMWQFGGIESDAYKAMLKADRLRYRMLPYIYSVAGAVTHDGSTFMRPLVMDFPDDRAARDVTDQYLFGPSVMVSPVTNYAARNRNVLLPGAGVTWYDFWTGKAIGPEGGMNSKILADAPYDQIPLHVRAGSILPLGPELQYTTEKQADPLTLMVYTGADAHFSLYEDDGLTYGYEKQQFSRIPMQYVEASHTLTVGKRVGSYPGMLQSRTIHVAFVTPEKPVGYSAEMTPNQTIIYTGEAVDVHR
jgi:alpha-D-xyloside xylohydrolase